MRLFAHPNLAELSMLADHARQKHNPGNVVTYIAGRNINYSNICWVQCKFCAFYDLPRLGPRLHARQRGHLREGAGDG